MKTNETNLVKQLPKNRLNKIWSTGTVSLNEWRLVLRKSRLFRQVHLSRESPTHSRPQRPRSQERCHQQGWSYSLSKAKTVVEALRSGWHLQWRRCRGVARRRKWNLNLVHGTQTPNNPTKIYTYKECPSIYRMTISPTWCMWMILLDIHRPSPEPPKYNIK